MPIKLKPSTKRRGAGKKLITISPDRYLGDSLDFNSEKMEKIWLAGFDKCGIVMDEVITE